ncbi:DUF932 domain-containing protein [Phycisphaerales bacterium AB-hyl4]|uniref:DUF932 domain-containing protein n=1 Tax=Natronomicrosphaera hydrolytica TaxID=3242702 RepID=A0ABV4U6Y0_9BACT
MVANLSNLELESQTLPLNALQVEYEGVGRSASRHERDRRTRVVLPDGRRMQVSGRFWNSFSALYNLSRSVFDYFGHDEVFDRITRTRQDRVRLTAQLGEHDDAEGRLLSATNPSRPLLQVGEVRQLVDEFDGQQISYANGVASATFECPYPAAFNIGGDAFRTQFNVQMPLDGYGMPSAYLSLLRLVCSNGMIGLARSFKTTFPLGRQETRLLPVMQRAMASFNNEEGFAAYRQRVEAASRSWASLSEAGQLHRFIADACTREGMDHEQRNGLLDRLDQVCGNPLRFYGLASVDELSSRRSRSVPVKATVYDLFNFASEVATHHLTHRQARETLQAWIGQSLVDEYDLEGTVESFPDYQDYFLHTRSGEGGEGGERLTADAVSVDGDAAPGSGEEGEA